MRQMCKLNEDMRNEAAREAATEAAMLKSIEMALNMLADGVLSYEKIAQYTGLIFDEVKELANETLKGCNCIKITVLRQLRRPDLNHKSLKTYI